MKYSDASRGCPFAKDPAVAYYRGVYYLYYSLPPFQDGRTPDGFAIGIASSGDLENWQKIGEILPQQPYEANGLCAPGAWVHNDRLHLFYQTYGNGPKDAICHAVSSDGIHFERDPTNPIFSPHGDWNNGRSIDADVLPVGNQLMLYFATRNPSGKVQKLGVARAPLDSDFSRPAWTQACTDSILQPELAWEQECIEAPAACQVGDWFYLFYGGAYNCSPQQIGVARSADGIHWQRLSDQPFLTNGPPGTWNASESGHPYVYCDPVSGRWYLFYQGSPDGGKTWILSRLELGWDAHGPYPKITD